MSRGTWEYCGGATEPFAYGAITLYGGSFQKPLARLVVCNSSVRPQPNHAISRYPRKATLAGLTPSWFGLIRVRSPLLTESYLLFVPGGNKMVQFPPFALHGAMNSLCNDGA